MPDDVENGGFETGHLAPWAATGTAFDDQPVRRGTGGQRHVPPKHVPLGGDYWKGGYDVVDPPAHGVVGEWWIRTDGAATGTLVSPPVVIGADRLWFSCLVGGTYDLGRVRVELLAVATDANRAYFQGRRDDGSPRSSRVETVDGAEHFVIFEASGGDDEHLRRHGRHLGDCVGERVRVRIVDDATAGHISVDDVRFSGDQPTIIAPPAPRVERAPLWGVADLHTHPLAHLAFGGKLFWGRPDGPVDDALAWCTPLHGPGGTFIGSGLGSLPLAFALETTGYGTGAGHLVGGHPQYDGWPRFTSRIHQQMHVDWIRRAHAGGLRLMIALAVNNQLLAAATGGSNYDDRTAVDAQIAAIRQFVGRHADLMEIAPTAAAARRIIGQDKLAVVLGVEVDQLNNWRDEGDATAADVRLYLERLATMGVRHIFPIHLADNAFGGCAVYSDMFAALSAYLNGRWQSVRDASGAGVTFRLGLAGPTGLGLPDYSGVPGGHANALGLTALGRTAIGEMMRLGMLIDIDHMSELAVAQTLELAEARDYPLVAGHIGLRELGLSPSESDNHGKRATEYGRTADELARMRRLGGVVAVGLHQGDLRTFSGRVPNDAAGSSKSWAQAYLCAVQHTGGIGVALGTDINGLPGSAAPRFGLNACHALHHAGHEDERRRALRAAHVAAQVNGVRYDTPVRDYRAYRFEGVLEGEVYDAEQRDVWEAIAIFVSGVDPNDAEMPGLPVRTPWQNGKIRNLAKGFRATSPAQLENPPLGGNTYNEQRAAFLVKSGQPPDDDAEIRRLHRSITPVWRRWRALDGGNPPLRRSLVGPQRDYDINLDGYAHYGMLPDFLQDLRNVGLSQADLAPLFRSAEDYIRAWEQCERRRPATLEARFRDAAEPIVGEGMPVADPVAVIDFGTVHLGRPVDVTLELGNTGTGRLDITDVAVDGAFRAFGGELAANTRIDLSDSGADPGDTMLCVVQFTPVTLGAHLGDLRIRGNAANARELRFALRGHATGSDVRINIDGGPDFGALAVGTTTSRSLTLHNAGDIAADVDAVIDDESPPDQFRVAALATRRLEPGASTASPVSCTATAVGPLSAALSVTARLADVPGAPSRRRSISLRATGAAPAVAMDPTELRFDPRALRTQSTPQRVVLRNTGDAPLTITSAIAGYDFRVTHNCDAVPAGAACEIEVIFAPGHVGELHDVVLIESNAPGSPHTIPVTGIGLAEPVVVLAPAAVDCGAQGVGTSGAPTAVTITNDGVATLLITGVTVGGAPDFQVVDGGCAGVSIQPELTCSVAVRFRPTGLGDRTAELVLTSNAAGSPHRIPLRGSGVPPPRVALDPTTVVFDAARLDGPQSTATVVLRNRGPEPFIVSAAAVEGRQSEHFDADASVVGAELDPGASRPIDVAFRPRAIGELRARLLIETNTGDRGEADLHGTGLGGALTFEPPVLQFPPQPVGSVERLELTLRNTGNVVVQLASIQVTSDFHYRGSCGPGIAPGDACWFRVVCQPSIHGAVTGRFTVVDSTGAEHVVHMSGRGVTPLVELDPAGISFDPQPVGSPGPPRTVTVTNVGDGMLILTARTLTGDDPGDFRLEDTSGRVVVPPGASHVLGVRFAPARPAARRAVLRLEHSATGSPHDIALTGRAT